MNNKTRILSKLPIKKCNFRFYGKNQDINYVKTHKNINKTGINIAEKDKITARSNHNKVTNKNYNTLSVNNCNQTCEINASEQNNKINRNLWKILCHGDSDPLQTLSIVIISTGAAVTSLMFGYEILSKIK